MSIPLSSVTSCLYLSSSLQPVVALQLMGWLVPAAIFFASGVRDQITGRVGRQFVLVLFGAYIFMCNLVLYILQLSLNIMRPDPFCPLIEIHGVPSTAAFYTAAGATFLVGLAIAWRMWYSLTNMVCIAVVAVGVPGVLVWFTFNTWQEVLLAVGMGIAASAAFVIAVWLYFIETLPYALVQFPLNWIPCLDTWVLDKTGQEKTERLRQWIAAREHASGPHCLCL